MRTEEEIVYDILNVVHGGNVSNDDQISERLVRNFLRKHRAAKLVSYMDRGWSVDDYVFQSLGTLLLEKTGSDYNVPMPALINFDNNEGVKLSKSGYVVPLLNEEAFELSKTNIINKSSPKATFDGQNLKVYVGNIDSCRFLLESPKEIAVTAFNEEIAQTDDNPKIYLDVRAVLYDPEQGKDYDWTRHPYPCPSEIIDQLTTSTHARDLNLLIRKESDKVPNNKPGLDPDYDRTINLQ